jgi:uncharacterized RDD family membrane protein YckC
MPMNCPYCRTVNDAAESRCARCGRRLHPASPRSSTGASAGPTAVPEIFPGGASGNIATAYALQPEEQPKTHAAANPDPETAPLARDDPKASEFQPSLFREVAGGPKVVPIPTLSPLRPSSPLEREGVRRNAMRAQQRRHAAEAQQRLDLQSQGEVQPRPEEVLFCDARVALPTQRTLAAAADGAAVLLGTGIFVGLALWKGIDFGIHGNLFLVPLGMVAVVAVLYRGLWCLANRDTPGMRFAGLRLVDFDGRTPRRDRRVLRQFAGLLSLASAGVGLAWALVDEESLTWHDHISKTFPTTA